MTTNRELQELLQSVKTALDEASAYCFLTRAIELQREAEEHLIDKKAEVSEFKRLCVSEANEDMANTCLAAEMLLTSIASELSMWIALKDDDPDSAWDSLVRAESTLQGAVAAHTSVAQYAAYSEHFRELEEVLFPRQLFMSPGMIIERTDCSICRADYEDCEHIAGRAYMGEFCARILYPDSLEELSIVEVPRDKRARVMMISDGRDNRDVMTWRKVGDAEE